MSCQLKQAACKVPGEPSGRSRLMDMCSVPADRPCVRTHDTAPTPVTRSREATQLHFDLLAVSRSPGVFGRTSAAVVQPFDVEDFTRGTVSPRNLRPSVLKVLGTSIRRGTDTQRAISPPGIETSTSLGLRPIPQFLCQPRQAVSLGWF